MIWSKSKPKAEFQYGWLFGEFNGMLSQSHVPHFSVKEFDPPYWKSFLAYFFLFLPCDAIHKRGYCRHAVTVRLSRSWVAPKRINISSIFFSPSGSQAILVFPYQTGWRYSDGNPPNGGVECKGVWKNDDFRPKSRSISETLIVRWAHAARQFVSIESLSIHTTFSVIAPGASPGETEMW